MKWDDSEYRALTSDIIKDYYKVYNTLGPGFLEKAYQRALEIELSKNYKVESEKGFDVLYEQELVSTYVPDLLVNDKVIIEVKAIDKINEGHKKQIIAQLRVSKILVGFVMNFGNSEPEFQRTDNYFELKKLGLFIVEKTNDG